MPEKNESTATSPGKFILLGEHAVVYGKPAIALAIDKRFKCSIKKDKISSINGYPLSLENHPHIKHILETNNLTNVAITTESQIPSSSGLGSSAALSSAISAAAKDLLGNEFDRKSIAKEAFDAEYYAQGRASPMDTSCCTFGKGVALNAPEKMGRRILTVEKGDNRWNVSEIDVPHMTFVIGYTGIKAATGPLVEKVRKYKEHNRFAADIVDEIENITISGMDAIRNNNVDDLGKMMTKDHKLLSILGVSCNELNKLVNASLRYSYGAKLTGAGGGGSMVALTDEPEKVCEAIILHGGIPFVVKTSAEGVTVN